MLDFIKSLFNKTPVAAQPRTYPEILVDSDVSYRDKYEEQLRNEITFLKSLLIKNAETISGPGIESLKFFTGQNSVVPKDSANLPENIKLSSKFTTFGSVRTQIEARLKQNAINAKQKD